MFKKFIFLPMIGLALSSCSHLPSPQDTQPTEESKCAAIRAKMMQNQAYSNNNTPTAVASSEQIDYQKIYHDECE